MRPRNRDRTAYDARFVSTKVPNWHSIPIACRVPRKRQQLPPRLLIENAPARSARRRSGCHPPCRGISDQGQRRCARRRRFPDRPFQGVPVRWHLCDTSFHFAQTVGHRMRVAPLSGNSVSLRPIAMQLPMQDSADSMPMRLRAALYQIETRHANRWGYSEGYG